MNDNWQNILNGYLKYPIHLQDISDFLKNLRDEGIAQGKVRSYLEYLRSTIDDETTDNRIIEILDIVEGFCQARYRVWPEPD